MADYATWVTDQLEMYANELRYNRDLLNQGVITLEEFQRRERAIEANRRALRDLREPVEEDSA